MTGRAGSSVAGRRHSRCRRPPRPATAAGATPATPKQPPPGGFTRTPPIRPETKAELLGGGYVFPVVGGAQFSDDFGGPRAETGFHQGIDLFSANGTPLVAVHDGTLFRVGWNRLGGWRLWLDDGQGNYFYYAHLSAYSDLARDGARVHAGDVIGYMGDTGDAQGTPFHLHFEMHPDAGWAVPPIAYVTAWESATPGVGSAACRHRAADTARRLRRPRPRRGRRARPGQSDISSVSGLDDAALAQAVGGGAEVRGPAPRARRDRRRRQRVGSPGSSASPADAAAARSRAPPASAARRAARLAVVERRHDRPRRCPRRHRVRHVTGGDDVAEVVRLEERRQRHVAGNTQAALADREQRAGGEQRVGGQDRRRRIGQAEQIARPRPGRRRPS